MESSALQPGLDGSGNNALALSKQSSGEHFTCGVCMDLMVKPTTLTCGHSFCRHCLAQWFLKTLHRHCPSCQSTWAGHPKINITLRNLIESLQPEDSEARFEAIQSDSVLSKFVEDFDKKLSDEQQAPVIVAPGHRGPLLTGFGIAVLFQIMFMMARYWISGGTPMAEVLIHKPLVKWSMLDVGVWVEGLGPWTQENVQPAMQHHRIDGLLLNSLTEDELEAILAATPAYQRRAVYQSLQDVKVFGRKPPTDFWEYKALHPLLTLFLATLIPQCPRITIVCLYVLEYWHMFLPLVHLTAPGAFVSTSHSLYATQFPVPSWGQCVRFSSVLVLFPYITFIDFVVASGMLQTNYIVALVALGNSVAMGMAEVISFSKWYKSPHRDWQAWHTLLVDSAMKTASHCFMVSCVYLFYNWIPSFVYSIWFYFNVYIGTSTLIKSVLAELRW